MSVNRNRTRSTMILYLSIRTMFTCVGERGFLAILSLVLLIRLLSVTVVCAAEQPNIIFIMSDDHAAHAISAYGSKVNKTPQLDRLAREGIRFDNCFVTNSLCAPSRAVILTGKYSHLNGVTDNRTEFDGSQQTLPKLMQQAGYRTALIGKWHLKSQPAGFDYTHILPGQGMYIDPVMIDNGKRHNTKGYVTDIITDQALDWLKEQRSVDQPFFLMLYHKAPHADWVADEKHMAMYEHGQIPLPTTFNDDSATRSAQIRNHRLHVGPKQWDLHFKRFGEIPAGLSKQETREWVYQIYMKNYLSCIASVDDNTGRLLDYLDQSGLSDNTVVIYTSDQGFFLGDHGLYDKRFMYEPSLRMPLLIRYPQEIKPGSSTKSIVLNLDFAPTLLDYAQVHIPEAMQGRSFRQITRGIQPADWRRAMYYRFYEEAFGIGPQEGIRTSRYKLIHYLYGDQGWEFYDLENDPDELDNQYDQIKNHQHVEELKQRMHALKVELKVPR